VVAADHQSPAGCDHEPLPARGEPVVDGPGGVGQHHDAGELVADRREQHRREELEAGLDRHERRPPERGEQHEQAQVAVPGHGTIASGPSVLNVSIRT